jgi:streptogramin lyase
VRLSATRTLSVGRGAGPLTVEGATVWVANPQAGTITKITGSGARLTVVMHATGTPVSLVGANGKLWVAERDANRIASYDTRTLARRDGAGLPTPVGVAIGPNDSVWALSLGAGALYQLDPTTGAAAEPIDSPVADPSEMVVVGDDLWLLGAGDHGLSPVNGRLGRIVRAGFSEPAQALSGLSASSTTIWLGETAKRALLRVDAATVAVTQLPTPYGISPNATAVGACGVWVADSSGELALADARTAAPLGAPLRVGHSIAALAPSGSGVWVSNPVGGTLVRVEARAAN